MGGASIQTSIEKTPKGFRGGVADSNPLTTDNVVAEAVVGIGRFCKHGSDNGVIPLSAITDSLAGVILKSDAFDGEEAQVGESLTLCRGGSVYVYSETACVKGENVFVRCVSAADMFIGDVRNDVDTDKAKESTKFEFDETLTGAGLVKIVKT